MYVSNLDEEGCRMMDENNEEIMSVGNSTRQSTDDKSLLKLSNATSCRDPVRLRFPGQCVVGHGLNGIEEGTISERRTLGATLSFS
jgi:hypothetical protein